MNGGGNQERTGHLSSPSRPLSRATHSRGILFFFWTVGQTGVCRRFLSCHQIPELFTGLCHVDRRNQPFCGWFLEANLGPRCRISSFFPNRLPSASQCGKSAPKKYGSSTTSDHCEIEGRRFGKNEEKRHLGPKFASRNQHQKCWFLRSNYRFTTRKDTFPPTTDHQK